ncbi:hypothetical protein AVEN_173595-1 [Araneus ventricosus]|uniref:Uncharacterized protein n=1 Tax=Araneus ventricosus TaxID=182803 RepID=A0A4Y2CQZ7_ARAVE|nr:hypothetical protein AVEN_173595-1 [Araneus ventricosus]
MFIKFPNSFWTCEPWLQCSRTEHKRWAVHCKNTCFVLIASEGSKGINCSQHLHHQGSEVCTEESRDQYSKISKTFLMKFRSLPRVTARASTVVVVGRLGLFQLTIGDILICECGTPEI